MATIRWSILALALLVTAPVTAQFLVTGVDVQRQWQQHNVTKYTVFSNATYVYHWRFRRDAAHGNQTLLSHKPG